MITPRQFPGTREIPQKLQTKRKILDPASQALSVVPELHRQEAGSLCLVSVPGTPGSAISSSIKHLPALTSTVQSSGKAGQRGMR